jgi:hypothetical protein
MAVAMPRARVCRPRATKTLPTASRKGPQGRVGELGFRGQGLPDEQPVGVVLVRFEAVRDERVEAEKVGGRFVRLRFDLS